jgi:hypothetical protein
VVDANRTVVILVIAIDGVAEYGDVCGGVSKHRTNSCVAARDDDVSLAGVETAHDFVR